MLIQGFPGFTQGVKDGPEQVGQTMQATVEATSAQQVRYVVMLVQKAISFRLVAAKVQGGYQSNRHNLSICYPTLAIFLMVKCFQKVVTNTENCYNLAVHVASWLVCGFSNYNFTRSYMDFMQLPKIANANMGNL